uniref:Rav1p_C domain-containing protein n=1 Tax=Haemonchus placei TaxID=6290 RepID=A0A158QQA6_HAEPC
LIGFELFSLLMYGVWCSEFGRPLPGVQSYSNIVSLGRTNSSNYERSLSYPLDTISVDGLFEAARLASPMLPQYHPKQLTVLLNAGRTERVKAILLNVLSALEQRQVSVQNPLSRAATMKRMSTVIAMQEKSSDEGQVYPDYKEIDEIAPLPLHSIVAADMESCVEFRKGESTRNVLMTNDSKQPVPTAFSVRHNRLLTELLTHTHLPGLSSVDQMHLLAIADTLSHFSADDVDELSLANAGEVGL